MTMTYRHRLGLRGLGKFVRGWAVVSGKYCQKIEELILSLGRDYCQRGSSSRLHLRFVNNRSQWPCICPSEIIFTRKNHVVGVLYVPCLKSIVAVIGLNQESVGLIKRSRIGEEKVDSDNVLKGYAWEDGEICSIPAIYGQILNRIEKWMSGKRKEKAWPYAFPSSMWNINRNFVHIHPSLLTHFHVPSHSIPRLVLCNLSRMRSFVNVEDYGMIHQLSFIYIRVPWSGIILHKISLYIPVPLSRIFINATAMNLGLLRYRYHESNITPGYI